MKSKGLYSPMKAGLQPDHVEKMKAKRELFTFKISLTLVVVLIVGASIIEFI